MTSRKRVTAVVAALLTLLVGAAAVLSAAVLS